MPAKSESTFLKKTAADCSSLLPPGSSILTAVSGGGDSTALLLLLHDLQSRLKIKKLGVAHVNHGLRGNESDGDERFVERLARRLELPFCCKKLSGRKLSDSGTEDWARKKRYAFFHEVKKREGYDFIATGHTADDQAETVLFRLMRGTGLRGLRGVLPAREDGVVRPVLGLRRRELHAWLKRKKVFFRHDASNDDCAYSRNRIRHEVIPLVNRREKKAAEKLVLIARKAQEFWRLFEPRVEAWTGKYVRKNKEYFVMEKKGFADLLHASEGLRSVFEEYAIPVDSFHLEEALKQSGRKSGLLQLPGGWRCYFRHHDIVFRRNEPGAEVLEFRCPLAVPGTTGCIRPGARFIVETAVPGAGEVPRDNLIVLLDRSVCGDSLIFRSWKSSDRFQPLGSNSATTVKDFLAKQKIAAIDRGKIGVVEGKDGRILWIPGVRICHQARVRRGSRKLLKISYQSCPSTI